MSKISHYLSMLFVAAGILLGVQLPNLMHQYVQRIDAHYLEVKRAAQPYHQLADRLFEGSMEQLLLTHSASDEPLFQQEAEPIRQLIQREDYLEIHRQNLSAPLWHQTWYLATQPDRDILQETLDHYQTTIPLTRNAIVCGLIAAILAALLYELCLLLLFLLFRPRKRLNNSATSH